MNSVTRHGAYQDIENERAIWPGLIETARAYRIATSTTIGRADGSRVSADTLIAVLAAFGVDARDAASCREALRELTERQFRPLPPCVVVRQTPARKGHADDVVPRVTVHAPNGAQPALWIALEDGGRRYDVALLHAQATERRGLSAYTFGLPAALPIGWHTLYARVGGETMQAPLAVAPYRLATPTRRRTWGYTLQLHSVRLSPLLGHGRPRRPGRTRRDRRARPRRGLPGGQPAARQQRGPTGRSVPLPARDAALPPDPIHLRIESVPEYAYAPPEVREQVDQIGAELRKRDLSDDLIDRDRVWEGKSQALRLLHSTPRTAGRSAAYRAYLAREGRALRLHATWLTLAQLYGANCADWPDALRNPATAEVAEGRRGYNKPRSTSTAGSSGSSTNSSPPCAPPARTPAWRTASSTTWPWGAQADGADTWADLDVYAPGVTIGAPADEFNQLGQDWSSRPWRPDRLAESGYLPYRQMLAGVLRHADGLRMDQRDGPLPAVVGTRRGQTARGHVRLLRPRGAARRAHP